MSVLLNIPTTLVARDLDTRRALQSEGCIRLASGVMFNPLNPDPALISIRDIAHGLSHLCRYGGHSPEFYSVAQHSVYVSRRFHTPWFRLAGLLHDAEEGLGLVDMPSPVKAHFPEYKKAGDNLRDIVAEVFDVGVHETHSHLIHEADQAVYEMEVERFKAGLMDYWEPVRAYAEFLREYDAITRMIEEANNEQI